MFARRPLNHALWLSLFVLVFTTLAPTFSAWQQRNQKEWVEICTTLGVKRVQLDADGQLPIETPSSGIHCPFCQSPAEHALPLPVFLLHYPTVTAPPRVSTLLTLLLGAVTLRGPPARGPPSLH
ncbi:hypothetical protein HNQ59_003299 [Chitinivorax tropicus]|uniref:DUF2946 domain-containing protein n=1 Tax=Chitinivorax tropicus TaxID=714531 RepID=A0A840MXW1_9PROT|nr:DUF2946 family protein [Chitinivorax tropicus]MBB5019991.1 hypothetical protein [Chitinivorax tropicus]